MRFFWLLLAVWLLFAGGPGFRTQRHLDDHYKKHGHEFGSISKTEYLRLAQELRDAPAGGPVLESKRRDGVVTRFHRTRGHFGAYNPDRTIRTFFIPVRGESYFRRQAQR
jgi:pyocin large subunit-like protein